MLVFLLPEAAYLRWNLFTNAAEKPNVTTDAVAAASEEKVSSIGGQKPRPSID